MSRGAALPRSAALLAMLTAAGGARAQDALETAPSVADTPAEAYVYDEVPEILPRRGLPQIRRDFEGGGFIRFYGHVNIGVLNYDDGRDSETYAPVDNANSVNRIGLLGERPLSEEVLATSRIEVGYGPRSSFFINQLDDDPDWEFNEDNIRHIDLNLRHDRYGALSLGQGGMATNGVALIDFSGTNVIAYSSVADSAAGQFLRFSDPTRPIADAPQVRAAFQGLDGPRRVRARYDTPSFMGLHASAAYGRNLLTTDSAQHDEDLFDLSLTYGESFGDVRFGAAAGYIWDRFDREVFSGSASALHAPTGLNLSFAAGRLDAGGRTAEYGWVKAGLRRDVFSVGETAVSADYYVGSDFAAAGSDSDSFGVALVQNVDEINTEFWLTLRLFDYDEPTADFESARAIFAGARFRF